MQRSRRSWIETGSVVGASLLSFVCAACGGGGDGGGGVTPVPPAVSLFDGSQWAFALSGNDVPQTVAAAWGTGTADGAGNFTVFAFTETNPPPTPGTIGWSYPVTVGPTGVFAWELPAGTDYYRGGLSPTGGVGALGSIVAGSLPQFLVTVRRRGTFSNASLSGAYHLAFFQGAAPSGAFWGGMTFDGAGTVTAGGGTANFDGLILPALMFAQPYSVAADGLLLLPTMALTGGVLEGGDLAVLGGSIGGPGTLSVLIRRSAAATAATLSGTYFIVGIERDATGYTSSTGTMASDGVGTVTLTLTQNDDGVVTANPPFTAPYTVAADGTLTAGPYQGGVAPSGDFGVVAGDTTAGNPPGFFFFVR